MRATSDRIRPSQDLVGRLRTGDEVAFREFFADVFPRLYRYTLARMSRDADGAEEVVQAALCKAVGKLHTLREDSALFSWICTFCRHEISAYYRSWRQLHADRALSEELPEVRRALVKLSAEAGDHDDTRRHVHETLDDLPVRYSDVLEWKYAEGSSVREIAGRLGTPEKTVESLLTRARAAFRERFERGERGRTQHSVLSTERERKRWSHG